MTSCLNTEMQCVQHTWREEKKSIFCFFSMCWAGFFNGTRTCVRGAGGCVSGSELSVFLFPQGSKVLSQDGTLSLQEVNYDHVGEYKCVGAVPSVPGLTAEAGVNLTVKGNRASPCGLCNTIRKSTVFGLIFRRVRICFVVFIHTHKSRAFPPLRLSGVGKYWESITVTFTTIPYEVQFVFCYHKLAETDALCDITKGRPWELHLEEAFFDHRQGSGGKSRGRAQAAG